LRATWRQGKHRGKGRKGGEGKVWKKTGENILKINFWLRVWTDVSCVHETDSHHDIPHSKTKRQTSSEALASVMEYH